MLTLPSSAPIGPLPPRASPLTVVRLLPGVRSTVPDLGLAATNVVIEVASGAGLDVFRGWQQLARFGGTLLSITTLLILVGLITSRGRTRAGVGLFGLGGLAPIVSPALSGSYSGCYSVPMGGPLVAAAAIALREAYTRIAPKASTMGHHAPH